MKFNVWWDKEVKPYITELKAVSERDSLLHYPAVEYMIRDACHSAWIIATKEGRQNAAKGGPLFKILRKCGLSQDKASWVVKRVCKVLLG